MEGRLAPLGSICLSDHTAPLPSKGSSLMADRTAGKAGAVRQPLWAHLHCDQQGPRETASGPTAAGNPAIAV